MDEMHNSGRYASETMSQFIVAQLLSLIAFAWEWNVIESSLSGPQEICVVSQISKSMLRDSKVSHILQFVFDSLYLKRSIRQGLVCVVSHTFEFRSNNRTFPDQTSVFFRAVPLLCHDEANIELLHS